MNIKEIRQLTKDGQVKNLAEAQKMFEGLQLQMEELVIRAAKQGQSGADVLVIGDGRDGLVKNLLGSLLNQPPEVCRRSESIQADLIKLIQDHYLERGFQVGTTYDNHNNTVTVSVAWSTSELDGQIMQGNHEV